MNKTKIIFWVSITALIGINVFTIKDGHNWGGDFSQYIIGAQNIINHRPYDSGIMLDPPFIYPPGFSLLLVPLIKFFGVNFKILKIPNVIFWYLSILCCYPVFLNKFGKEIAGLGCLLLSVSASFFVYKQNILSDIPFFFFVSCTLYVFEKFEYTKKTGLTLSSRRLLFLLITLMSCATLIRSAGIILFAAFVFHSLVIRRDWKMAGVGVLSALGVIGLQTSFIGTHPGVFSQLTNPNLVSPPSILRHYFVAFRSIVLFFCPLGNILPQDLYHLIDNIIPIVAAVFYLSVGIIFIMKVKKRSLSFLGCFFVFYIAVFLFWSGFETSSDALGRLVYPILGSALVLGIGLLRSIGDRFITVKSKIESSIKVILFTLIFVNLMSMAALFCFDDDVIYKKENQELFSWVKQNTRSDEHYMFWVPNTMALLTGRVGTAFFINPSDRAIYLPERIKKFNISYLITIKLFNIDKEIIKVLQQNPNSYRLVWENEYYKIFKVLY